MADATTTAGASAPSITAGATSSSVAPAPAGAEMSRPTGGDAATVWWKDLDRKFSFVPPYLSRRAKKHLQRMIEKLEQKVLLTQRNLEWKAYEAALAAHVGGDWRHSVEYTVARRIACNDSKAHSEAKKTKEGRKQYKPPVYPIVPKVLALASGQFIGSAYDPKHEEIVKFTASIEELKWTLENYKRKNIFTACPCKAWEDTGSLPERDPSKCTCQRDRYWYKCSACAPYEMHGYQCIVSRVPQTDCGCDYSDKHTEIHPGCECSECRCLRKRCELTKQVAEACDVPMRSAFATRPYPHEVNWLVDMLADRCWEARYYGKDPLELMCRTGKRRMNAYFRLLEVRFNVYMKNRPRVSKRWGQQVPPEHRFPDGKVDPPPSKKQKQKQHAPIEHDSDCECSDCDCGWDTEVTLFGPGGTTEAIVNADCRLVRLWFYDTVHGDMSLEECEAEIRALE